MSARYVALREILLYHVGYECKEHVQANGDAGAGAEGESVWEEFCLNETLLVDHNREDLEEEDLAIDAKDHAIDHAMGEEETRRRHQCYRGVGEIRESVR